MTIALRGDRSIVTVPITKRIGIPPVQPHGGAKKDKSGRDGGNIEAIRQLTDGRNNRRNEASRACPAREKRGGVEE